MTKTETNEIIKRDEFDGEKLISRFRFCVALIYSISVPSISIMRGAEGLGYFPPYAYICSNVFLLYSISLFFYLRKKDSVHYLFKYICIMLDMIIISASVWVGCTYLETAPPISFLSTWALFYSVLIMLGAFRYSVPCAYFSGIFAGFCYLLTVLINGHTLDLPYFFKTESVSIPVSFPLYYEFFRVIAMILTGFITGMACKRHLKLFINMLETQTAASDAASKTVEQTRNMADIIKKSTDEIFLSSKDIFTIANNQAASIQEIERTINENARIVEEIADKTYSVACIASKMENDVIHGFDVLERNVNQLEDIKNKNDNVITGIISLGNKIIKISDIIKNINTITDQTKVIAFNATLESANAGENGKRFAVVAGEVNRLADNIASLTSQIRGHIEEIQSSSSALIIFSKEGAEKIAEGNNLIKELENIFREIRSGAEITTNQAQTITVSTQKQLKSTGQINMAIADISEGLSKFIQSTRAASSSADDLTQMIGELAALLNSKKGIGE
jgi:methyl-accepting chemotaxis protein